MEKEKMRHEIKILKKKLEARTSFVDYDIKTGKSFGEDVARVVSHEHENFRNTTKGKIKTILVNFTGTYDEVL